MNVTRFGFVSLGLLCLTVCITVRIAARRRAAGRSLGSLLSTLLGIALFVISLFLFLGLPDVVVNIYSLIAHPRYDAEVTSIVARGDSESTSYRPMVKFLDRYENVVSVEATAGGDFEVGSKLRVAYATGDELAAQVSVVAVVLLLAGAAILLGMGYVFACACWFALGRDTDALIRFGWRVFASLMGLVAVPCFLGSLPVLIILKILEQSAAGEVSLSLCLGGGIFVIAAPLALYIYVRLLLGLFKDRKKRFSKGGGGRCP